MCFNHFIISSRLNFLHKKVFGYLKQEKGGKVDPCKEDHLFASQVIITVHYEQTPDLLFFIGILSVVSLRDIVQF